MTKMSKKQDVSPKYSSHVSHVTNVVCDKKVIKG